MTTALSPSEGGDGVQRKRGQRPERGTRPRNRTPAGLRRFVKVLRALLDEHATPQEQTINRIRAKALLEEYEAGGFRITSVEAIRRIG